MQGNAKVNLYQNHVNIFLNFTSLYDFQRLVSILLRGTSSMSRIPPHENSWKIKKRVKEILKNFKGDTGKMYAEILLNLSKLPTFL